jgi:hypothetical protein
MILALTGNNETILGIVASTSAIGSGWRFGHEHLGVKTQIHGALED